MNRDKVDQAFLQTLETSFRLIIDSSKLYRGFQAWTIFRSYYLADYIQIDFVAQIKVNT